MFSALPGSRAAASVARLAGHTVWAVAGTGRVLPGRVWDSYVTRLTDAGDAWDLELELVPLALVDAVVGPLGVQSVADALCRADCPIAPELLRSLD
jgi:hypothetical protein